MNERTDKMPTTTESLHAMNGGTGVERIEENTVEIAEKNNVSSQEGELK